MGDSEMSTDMGGSSAQGDAPIDPKGKGKAVDPAPQDMSMEEDDDDSGEEEEEVRPALSTGPFAELSC